MDSTEINSLIKDFCRETHGSSNYDSDTLFVMGETPQEYMPWSYLKKKLTESVKEDDLISQGYIYGPHDISEGHNFRDWYEKQFAKKLPIKTAKEIFFLYKINSKVIFKALEEIHKNYNILREQRILINSKNFPTQLGEWYAKSIFGLRQTKSTSQRGFDFELGGEKIEVKVHWKIHAGERPSPKGVKIKKSLIQLSKSCIIIYLSQNFTIKEICFLDSEFILRKFIGKGHTIFLKDSDIQAYFFSKSAKQFDKIVNRSALMNFSSPTLAMKLDDKLTASPQIKG